MTDTDNAVQPVPLVEGEFGIAVPRSTAEDGGGCVKSPDPETRAASDPGDRPVKLKDDVRNDKSSMRVDPTQGDDSAVNGKRKRHRRKAKGGRHHRKWKPYNKLTWEERKVADDREEKRACMKREERFASGQPMAPYNTTQFLMEQHESSGAIIESHAPRHRSSRGDRDGSWSLDSGSDDCDSSVDDEETFMEREFTEAYESEHAERLQRMTKDELVREYLELEAKNEKLEKNLRSVNDLTVGANNNVARVSLLEAEIVRLRQENGSLLAENNAQKGGMTVTVDNPGAASA